MNNRRLAYVVIFAAFASILWMARFSISSSSKADGPAIAYVLDRWTNTMHVCQGVACYPVQNKTE